MLSEIKNKARDTGGMEKENMEKIFRRVGVILFVMTVGMLSLPIVVAQAEEAGIQQDPQVNGGAEEKKTPEAGEVFTKIVKTKVSDYNGKVTMESNSNECKFKVTKSAIGGEGEVEFIGFSVSEFGWRKVNKVTEDWDSRSLYIRQTVKDHMGNTYKITSIGNRACVNSNCDIHVSSKYLRRIGDEAFAGCGYVDLDGGIMRLEYGRTKPVKIENLAYIGKRAFANDKGGVLIRAKKIGKVDTGAFTNNGDAVEMYCDTFGSGVLESCDGKLVLYFDKRKTIDKKIFSRCKYVRKIEIEGKKLNKIVKKAFSDCKKVKVIWIGSGSEKCSMSIGDRAFSGCKNLESIELLHNGIRTIGSRIFSGCKRLKVIDLNGTNIRTIGSRIFSGCKKLKKITVYDPDKVKTVKKDAFAGASSKCRFKVVSSKKSKALRLKGKGIAIWWRHEWKTKRYQKI